MDHTVDAAHERVLLIIAMLRGACESHPLETKDIAETVGAVAADYQLSVVGRLTHYYAAADAAAARAASDEYWGAMMSGNIPGQIAWCTDRLADIAALAAVHLRLTDIKIRVVINSIAGDRCECGERRVNLPRHGDMYCYECGTYMADVGMITDDMLDGYGGLPRQRQKTSGHDASRHWRIWTHRIQAREKYETPDDVRAVVRAGFKGLGIRDADSMHCSMIRIFLKDADMSCHNDHVPTIRKDVCGIVPPQITHEENVRGAMIFHRACEIYVEIRPDGFSNNMYYPYMVRKIWECILPDGDRKNRIIDCIHMQGHDVTVRNDCTWELICVKLKMKEVVYRPTNRAEYRIR
jgi:hypothetical protein